MPFLWLASVLALLGCAGSAARPVAAERPVRTLTIVGINDVHGALLPARAGGRGEIGGADWLAGDLNAIRAEARERGAEVPVLDGGDEFQGTMISNPVRGRGGAGGFNAVGIPAA